MRISFLCHEFPPTGGGAATALDEITRILVRVGHAVQVITIGLRGNKQRVERDAWGRYIVRLSAGRSAIFSPSPAELLLSCLSLRFFSLAYLRRFTPEVLVAFFGFPAGLIAVPLAHKLRVPLAVSLRGSDVPGFYSSRWGVFRRFQNILVHPVWRHADVLIANGQHLTDLAEQCMPTKKLVNIPNGVDTKRFYPVANRPKYKPLRLLYVGQLIERKRILEVLQALSEPIETPVTLTIVGDGSLRDKVAELGARMPGNILVEILGYVPRETMPEIYRRHDTLVHLSQAEGLSNVLLEALASGLAVITTPFAIDNLPVRNVGIVVDPVTPEEIRKAIRLLDRNRMLLGDKQQSARILGASMTWQETARQFEENLQGLIGICVIQPEAHLSEREMRQQ